jgi:glycolate oxidase FAD binding subunit
MRYHAATAFEMADVVRAMSREGRAIAPVGAGTMLGLGNPPERSDVVLSTRAMRRIVEYSPEDQIVVVEAGVAIGELQSELGKRGQRLAVDSPNGDGATIGGMLATNAYGPSALRYGTLKDLIVGVEFVRADGVVAHAGGKVVKNVAGFDLSKLLVGSLGTLAIITRATFRAHPLPESTRKLTFNATTAHVFPFVLALREAQLEPAALLAHVRGHETTIEVTFEGFGPGVNAQSEMCEKIAHCHPERSDAEHRVVEGQSKYRLKATFPPSEFARVAEEVKEGLAFPSLGVMYCGGPSTTDAPSASYARDDALPNALRLRQFFESLGGTLVVQDMPQEWYGKIDAWGTPPPSFKLMRALKERFDPERRFNPGRFVGGL